jgi:hypothetical protein
MYEIARNSSKVLHVTLHKRDYPGIVLNRTALGSPRYKYIADCDLTQEIYSSVAANALAAFLRWQS